MHILRGSLRVSPVTPLAGPGQVRAWSAMSDGIPFTPRSEDLYPSIIVLNDLTAGSVASAVKNGGEFPMDVVARIIIMTGQKY